MLPFPFTEIENGLFSTGFKAETYNEDLPAWIKEFGDSERSKKDYIWHCYNLALSTCAKEASSEEMLYGQQRGIYLEMIKFRGYENKSPDNIRKALNFLRTAIK